jgi:cellulose synthase/poly-beta-1,6-N-acetylglucosamine synthase-like glycosyltransferase/peptidoglycan/xylan/chitin deacetylase (PgdA/CDA1 family)
VLIGVTVLALALVVQHEMATDQVPDDAIGCPVAAGGTALADPAGQLACLTAQPGTVSLTFAAGTGGDLVPQITAALRRLGVPGTFFVQAAQVARQRAAIRQQVTFGDDVGLAWPAGLGPARLPGWWLGAALTSAQYQLQRAGGPASALVQVPGAGTAGTPSSRARAADQQLAQLGYVAVLADHSGLAARSPQDVLRAVSPSGLAPAGHRPGPAARTGIVLSLADTGGPGLAALRALPSLVSALRGNGYRFTTVPAAFGLSVQPAEVTSLSAAGAAALLRAAWLAGVLTEALGWIFLVAAALIVVRLILLILTGVRHRRRDRQAGPTYTEPVSVIIPAYNERAGIIRCLRSMLFSAYPSIEVILVDDGSTDGTADLVRELGLPVTIVRQRNAGKAAALNAGIRQARYDILVLADGDTVFEPVTIRALVAPFRDPLVGAVAGNVKVANRGRLLGRIQYAEYVLGSSLDRRMYDVLGCMVTIPGAVGAFRREAIADVGGVPGDTLAEDTDLTIAIGEIGWRTRYTAHARAWTEAPFTLGQLWTQRHRWAYGTIQSLWKHRRTLVSPSGRWALAWIGLPYLFLMSCVLPLISPAADTYLVIEAWIAPWRGAALAGGYLITQGTLALAAFLLDRERLRYLWTLPVQQLFYRQLIYLVALHSMATAVTGVRLRWHKLERIGVSVPTGKGQPRGQEN